MLGRRLEMIARDDQDKEKLEFFIYKRSPHTIYIYYNDRKK